MLLGYRKEDNPILPPEHLRGVFNLTGIVHPTVLAGEGQQGGTDAV